jgi:3-methyl-2-oxobutanoate hydroxymethyltransferase
VSVKKVTVSTLLDMKHDSQKISMLTAYDYALANILDEAEVDVILVGDSLGMVALGYDDTLPVTIEEMIHHTKAVMRGVKRALVVTDMPFMSYQISDEKALENAGMVIKQTGAHGVKLEGGKRIVPVVQKMTDAGIPVMGHLGLTPQSIRQFGGYGLQAANAAAAKQLLDDSLALEAAGAFAVVLEKIPSELAEMVTASLKIPTFGIGAGPSCDGQVLVVNDMLGMFEKFLPKFAKRYTNLRTIIDDAVKEYIDEVKNDLFPASENSFYFEKETLEKFKGIVERSLGNENHFGDKD